MKLIYNNNFCAQTARIMTNTNNLFRSNEINNAHMSQVYTCLAYTYIKRYSKVLAANNTTQKSVTMSKKASDARTVYYKPNIKNTEMRYSNLSKRTLRY